MRVVKSIIAILLLIGFVASVIFIAGCKPTDKKNESTTQQSTENELTTSSDSDAEPTVIHKLDIDYKDTFTLINYIRNEDKLITVTCEPNEYSIAFRQQYLDESETPDIFTINIENDIADMNGVWPNHFGDQACVFHLALISLSELDLVAGGTGDDYVIYTVERDDSLLNGATIEAHQHRIIISGEFQPDDQTDLLFTAIMGD